MAQLISDIQFTGSLGKFSAYKMKGTDKIILRKKGGPSKKKIDNAPEFKKTRNLNAEFGGRSLGSKYVMRSMHPLKALADYNVAGPLNALIKPIQAMDAEGEFGKRGIYFSRHAKLLEGFNLNKRNTFDSIVRNPLACRLDKKDLSAGIDVPALIPGINFFVPPGRYSFYSIIVVIGILPDVKFQQSRYLPLADADSEKSVSPWYPVSVGLNACTLDVSLKTHKPQWPSASFSVILSAGIRFGEMGKGGEVEQVKWAGAGKVLAVVVE